jgi:hypothetical protein
MKKLLLGFVILIYAISLNAQTTYLKNGEKIKGKIVGKTDSTVIIKTWNNIHYYYNRIINISDIKVDISSESKSSSIMIKEPTIGDELKMTAENKMAGSIFCMIGIGLIITPTFMPEPKKLEDMQNFKDNNKTIIGIGGGLFIIGSIFHISAVNHLKIAGQKINLQTSKDGVGIKIKF